MPFRLLAGVCVAWALPALLPPIVPAAIAATLGCFAFGHWAIHDLAVTGTAVTLSGATVQIVSECTSLEPTLLLVGAMLAYPAPWRSKLVGVAIATCGLWVFNLMRILILLVTLKWLPGWFDLLHVFLWQSATILVVIAFFLVWLRGQPSAGRR